jgi:predicted deacetylase
MIAKRLLVAIHDVTPAHRDRVMRVLTLLDGLGVRCPALFVVPDWHGEWPLAEHPEFVAELRRRRERGAEVFLHGYRHDEAGHRRTLHDRVRVFGRTAGSAEFMMLDASEAARRMDRGLADLRALGLDPIGFVPPAWLFAPHTRSLMKERNLTLTETFGWVECLEGGSRVFAPALSWSTARRWRSRVTSWLAGARTALESPRGLVRVAIHPPDIDTSTVRESLERALDGLMGLRMPARYQDLFGQ